MGFGDSSLFLKIAFILLIVALIIQILGLALPYWYEAEYNNIELNAGLFRSCIKNTNANSNSEKCSNIKGDDLESWLEATRAFEIIGLLLIVAALVLTIVVIFVKDMKILKLIAWICSLAAFGFIFIGFCIYAGEIDLDEDYANLSGAFAIIVINSVVCLVAGILGLVDWMGKAP